MITIEYNTELFEIPNEAWLDFEEELYEKDINSDFLGSDADITLTDQTIEEFKKLKTDHELSELGNYLVDTILDFTEKTKQNAVKKNIDEFSEYQDLLSKAFIDSVLQAIKEGALYGFYEGVSDTDVTKIHEIIQAAFMRKRLSLSEMIDDIMKATSLDFDKSRLIARTEMHNVSQSARKIEWQNMEKERGETFKYLWSVKHDHRTSPQCLEIEELAGSGKSLVEMEKIIQQVAQKYIPKWKAEMTPHPNCRSTLIRVV